MVLKTVLRLVAAVSIGLLVASCQDEMQSGLAAGGAKANRPLKPEMVSLLEKKGMRKEDPILVRVFKQESTLEVWKRDQTGRYAFLKSYPLCAWGGTLGPKIKEGDKQSPEGFYTITPSRMNPNSQFHLAYDVGYPNAFDRAFNRTGSAVMVHGGCVNSAGCFIVTDEQVEELYGLAREAFNAGQRSFQLQAYPFRMTAENLAKNRKSPNVAFWRNLKQGYDHFEVTKLEPKVEVCDRHYVFDPRITDPNASTFTATASCPTYTVAGEIATAVAAKQVEDEKAFKVAVAELDELDRKETQRAVADKAEKSKPATPSSTTRIAGLFGADQSAETLALASEPVTVDVPLPRPSPNVLAASQGTGVADGGRSTSFASRVFGFGSSEPEAPAVAAAAAVAEPMPSGRPIVVPLPQARPDAVQTAQAQGTAAPLPASVAAPSASQGGEDKPVWKKLNPFGG